eukprot:TRINITY_DN2974_c0_g1_i1.p1 TRINITY_DN2974_c0_g1~~TRINITY_DN2974_c0_g1_i1.p1  ORF type:complete len:119 (-),score=38.65 TRINITY_DN2974_c0_g1_i1:65-397(-)
MGSINMDWNVNNYYSKHEPSHHWELRRKFMESNKGRFDEEKIVSLAQIFANTEFLGCKYPKETMELVDELSFGIVQEYRESQKSRLQRTFVSGSSAAGNKVNRTKRQKTQ